MGVAAIVAAIGLCGCSATRAHTRTNAAASDSASPAAAGAAGSEKAVPPSSPEQLQRQLAGNKQLIQELEQQLSAQETELAQARQEAGELREQEQTARTELRDLQAQVEKNRAPYVAMAATNAGSWDASEARSGEGPAPQGGSSLVATLRQKLIDEREQRVRLERELQRLQALQEEMSSGPFENKMQNDLTAARKQIEELKQALNTERKARQDLAHRYEQLQVELTRLREERPAAPTAKTEEIAALEERQKRVLASIERDLLVSREREADLRNALQSSQGPDAVPLASAVSDLRAENDALQTRLDDEHRHNRELSAKLSLAARVTDLIFKMRSSNSAGALPSQ